MSPRAAGLLTLLRPRCNHLKRLGLLGHTLRRKVIGYGQESHRLLDDFGRHRLLGCLLLVDAPDFNHTELSLETAW